MQFSNAALLSILALATSAMAAPADLAKPVLAPEGLVETAAEGALEKRFAPIAILLGKVIGGQLLAGAARASIDVAKSHLESEGSSFKTFDDARKAFTPEMAKDLYEKRIDSTIKGVACFNGPYSFAAGSKYAGPVNIKFKWDIYNTDYDCFEMYPGSFVHNNGDGGYQNIAYYGICSAINGGYQC